MTKVEERKHQHLKISSSPDIELRVARQRTSTAGSVRHCSIFHDLVEHSRRLQLQVVSETTYLVVSVCFPVFTFWQNGGKHTALFLVPGLLWQSSSLVSDDWWRHFGEMEISFFGTWPTKPLTSIGLHLLHVTVHLSLLSESGAEFSEKRNVTTFTVLIHHHHWVASCTSNVNGARATADWLIAYDSVRKPLLRQPAAVGRC